MRHEEITSDIQETAALYALGALTADESRAFESHLQENCEVCEAELRRYRSVVGVMGLAATPATPPEYLRDVLAARVERDSRESKSPEKQPSGVAPSAPERPSPREKPRRFSMVWALAAGLAGVGVLLFVFWQRAENSLQEIRQLAQRTQEEVRSLQSVLEEERRKSAQLDAISRALASPGSKTIQLGTLDPAVSASAAIFWNTEENRWIVTGNLPPPPDDKTYQLWFVTPTTQISAGLLPVDASGRSFQIVQVPPAIGTIAAAAVTLEPTGGSERPTMPIYLIGRL